MAYAIEASATHMLSVLFRANKHLQEVDMAAIKEGSLVSQKMIQGTTLAPKKVCEAIKGISRGIQELGKRIKPVK